MHSLLSEHLEGYLSGNLGQADQQALEAHVSACPECRGQMAGFVESAELIRALRPPQDVELEPAAGLYARVMEKVDQEREVPFWATLLDPSFGRRLVFACLMLLALLGTYVAALERPDYPSQHRPEVLLTRQESLPVPEAQFGSNLEQNRGAVLASLVADGD